MIQSQSHHTHIHLFIELSLTKKIEIKSEKHKNLEAIVSNLITEFFSITLNSWTVIHSVFYAINERLSIFFCKDRIIRRIALVLVWFRIIIYEREKHLVCWMDLALQGKVYYQFFPFYNPGTLEKLNFLEMLEFCSVFGFCPFSMQCSPQLL